MKNNKINNRIIIVILTVIILTIINVYFKNSRLPSAINVYTSINNDPETILNYSKYKHSVGGYKEAIEGYEAVINNPSSSKSLKLKAQAYLILSQHGQALEPIEPIKYLEDSKAKSNEFKRTGYVFLDRVDYITTGDYFNASKETCYHESEFTHLDENGLPMVKYSDYNGGDGSFHYNPVTIAQFSLTAFGRYKNGTGTKKQFIDSIDKLLSLQSPSGAMRLDFSFKHYINNDIYKPGWVSSLAQGQAISAFVRAYQVTGDNKYLDAADKAYMFMCIPVNEGGTKDTSEDLDGTDNVFFQEYITTPKSYTLNGFIFTIIGIYDLSQTKDSIYKGDAHKMFVNCNDTLLKVIHKYDLGCMTAYDAAYITKKDQYPNMNIQYHASHIELVDAMYSITNNPIYKYYNLMWKSYVV
ncbi:D-glucuronyl C5-epimerase family protein [Clostridium kluyveri]|uniref:D-glucuronyl C5-epimerase C-terminal domain-containing protein n=2 Tax=Clostridium kluyveri TaxID=1534 RepID=A5N576_CLOK5|nr:D-glucuronyl C5-epimerase family protein [Clostridium kluyveri]EDK32457.1 Conserved hypothetical protein [Clostridium kluyveri DSM 555]